MKIIKLCWDNKKKLYGTNNGQLLEFLNNGQKFKYLISKPIVTIMDRHIY